LYPPPVARSGRLPALEQLRGGESEDRARHSPIGKRRGSSRALIYRRASTERLTLLQTAALLFGPATLLLHWALAARKGSSERIREYSGSSPGSWRFRQVA